MGARISKRGSYNLKKREKESRRNKLEGRTSSVINLTLSQIYEDELKTPRLDNHEKHKDFGQIYENENAVTNKNEPILNTIQNINDRSDSERDDYSNPDNERIYENIVDESNSNFEEQVEKKEEKKRRKTYSQSETHDGDKYFGVRHSISEESERSNEQWKEILNGGYWKNENNSTLAEQIEVKEDKSQEQVEVVVNNKEREDLDMQQLEVNINESANDKGEQIVVTEINHDLQYFHNDEQVEVLSEDISYEQIEVKADVQQNNFQEIVEVSTQAKPESILHQNWEFENKVEESTQSTEPDNLSQQKDIDDQIEKNVQMEKTESVTLHLEEELKSDTEQNKNDTQNEFKDINIQQNHEINNTLQAEDHNIDDSYIEKEDKVNKRPQGHRPFSKTVSSTSDAFYEIASEGLTEDSEYEDLEFYDAEDFQNETQIEVVDEELRMNTNKGVLSEITTAELEEKLNHNTVLEAKDTNEVIDMKSQTELESPNINLKEDNIASEGLLIDIDYSKSESDNFVTEREENLLISVTSNTANLTENTNEASLIQIDKNVEPSYNESEPPSSLIDLNEDSKPVELPNPQLGLLESSNSDLLLEFTNLESSGNGKDVAFQADLLIDLNEEPSSVNKETDHLKQSADLELNNKFQEDVENDRNDTLKNQFVPLIETNTEDKNNAITKEVEIQFVDTKSNAIHMEYIDEHKSSKTEDLQKEHYYNNTDTIYKLESSLISKNNNDQHNPQSPSVITTEDIAKDQMKVWEKQKDEEDEGTLLQINTIINNINQVKLQIDNLGSTEKDQDIHVEMYQTLIKLMRDVNSINNYNFNEKIIELQNMALSKVHNCLKNLQMRKT